MRYLLFPNLQLNRMGYAPNSSEIVPPAPSFDYAAWLLDPIEGRGFIRLWRLNQATIEGEDSTGILAGYSTDSVVGRSSSLESTVIASEPVATVYKLDDGIVFF